MGRGISVARVAWILLLASLVFAAPADQHIRLGARSYVAKAYSQAERHFRDAISADPNDYRGYMFLGHTLNVQKRYEEEIGPYERALSIERPPNVLTLTERRVVTDHLVYAYYSTGKSQKAEGLLRAAIKRDPDYPLYYYNLAGLQAERSELDNAIANLRLAFHKREHMLEGESFPDPRQDPSFKRYLSNPQFQKLVREMGFSK